MVGYPNTKGAVNDSRVRLQITATEGNTTTAVVRIKGDNDPHTYGPTAPSIDKAYISTNVGGGFTVKAGHDYASWGHNYYIYDERADRVAIAKSVGDLALGLTFTKTAEAGLYASNDDSEDI